MAVDGPQTAIARGAGVALAVALPVLLVSIIIDALLDDPSEWMGIVLFLAVLAGFAAGGREAARRVPSWPLLAGALAALSAYVVIAVLAVLRLAVSGDLTNEDFSAADRVVAFVSSGFISSACGLFGGIVAARRLAIDHIDRRTQSDDEQGRFR